MTNFLFNSRIRDYVQKYKESQPCRDCGVVYPPWIMDFDHTHSKLANVSQMASKGYTLEQVQKEIAKCELVCANCHRTRTHQRRLDKHL